MDPEEEANIEEEEPNTPPEDIEELVDKEAEEDETNVEQNEDNEQNVSSKKSHIIGGKS